MEPVIGVPVGNDVQSLYQSIIDQVNQMMSHVVVIDPKAREEGECKMFFIVDQEGLVDVDPIETG